MITSARTLKVLNKAFFKRARERTEAIPIQKVISPSKATGQGRAGVVCGGSKES